MIRRINMGMVNLFLVGEDPYVLVDTGMKSSGKKLLDYLYAYDINPKSIELIVLTHGHEDHIGSLDYLRKATGANVLISDMEYRTLTCEVDHGIKPVAGWVKVFHGIGKIAGAKPKPVHLDVDILMEETFDLEAYGVEGQVVLTPGHSKGSVSVLVGKEAIVGDSLMAFRKKSLPGRPFIAYDLDLVKKSMMKLMDMGAETFYLSHGSIYDIEEMKEGLDGF